MEVVRTAEELDRAARGGVLVPTMGDLHEGHLALVRLAREHAHRLGNVPVVVSVYVNPTQFGESADFSAYPRNTETDAAAADAAGADVVFAPEDRVVYPDGHEAVPDEPLPAVAIEPGLEDRWREGHFRGVCAVCRRLFAAAGPAAVVFGEKDWQQLQVIRAMVAMDSSAIEVVAGRTVREADGLAMSSRNRRLSTVERSRALALCRALECAGEVEDPAEAERRAIQALEGGGVEVEYACVRDAETLGPMRDGQAARTLIAARIGKTRLIDNAPWPGFRLD